MNPMTNMKNVLKLSEQELRSSSKSSWHDQYRHSAWVFVGGLPYDLTEGDIICVFSQYGEVVNLNLVRDKGTGKPRGFCFVCYEDQRSTNLAVDNFNGVKLLNRTIRVDHCEGYKAPKDDKMDEETRQLHAEGCAPGSKFGRTPQLPSSSASNGGLDKGLDLPSEKSLLKPKTEQENSPKIHMEEKKSKKERSDLTKKDEIKNLFKRRDRHSSSSSCSENSISESEHERTKKRKSQKKSKQKGAQDASSSSEESGRDNRKKPKKFRKCSSSESEEETLASNEAKRGMKDLDMQKVYDSRLSVKSNFPGKNDIAKYYGGSRDFGKNSNCPEKWFNKSDKGREDHSGKRQEKDRSYKNREESRRFDIGRNAGDDKRGEPGHKTREEGRHHEGRRRKDYHY